MACPGTITHNGLAAAGDGGKGGGITDTFPLGKAGTQRLEKGQSLSLNTGVGGGGGSCVFSGGQVVGGGRKFKGLGAYGGSVADATSGTGGEGGAGGDITIVLGHKGPDGVGDTESRTMDRPFVSVYGGRGGDGELPDTVGGDGGQLTISQVGGGAPAYDSLALNGFGNGGTGASGCYEDPKIKGEQGGRGLQIVVNGATGQVTNLASLKGGDGGSGKPGGPGGVGPGGDGANGVDCSQVRLVVVLAYDVGEFPKGSNIPLSRIQNAHVARPENPVTPEHGCQHYHLHADPGKEVYIYTAGGQRKGPFADPDMNHCGFGPVYPGLIPPPQFSAEHVQADADCCNYKR